MEAKIKKENQYISVSTMLEGAFRHVDGNTTIQLCGPQVSSENMLLREAMVRQSRLPETLLQFLIAMDNKLDSILGRLQHDSIRKKLPYTCIVTRISGTGCVFDSDKEVALHSYIELAIVLMEYPLQAVSAIGKVVHAGVHADTRRHVYELQFSTIREEDQEAIITYAFQEERRRIRQAKHVD